MNKMLLVENLYNKRNYFWDPIERLIFEKKILGKERKTSVDDKYSLCFHGNLHPLI